MWGGDASRQAPSPGPREGADMAHRRSGLWMGTWRDLHPGTRRARLTEQSPVQKTPGHTWGPGVWSRCCPVEGGRTDFCSVTLRQPGTTCKYTRASRRAPARLREGQRAVATEQSLAVTRKKRGGSFTTYAIHMPRTTAAPGDTQTHAGHAHRRRGAGPHTERGLTAQRTRRAPGKAAHLALNV